MKKKTRRNKLQPHHENLIVSVIGAGVIVAVSFLSVQGSLIHDPEFHGASMYQPYSMPNGYQSPVPYFYPVDNYYSPSPSTGLRAQARAKVKSRIGVTPSSKQTCSDRSCTNLIDTFLKGDPTCMKVPNCVKAVNEALVWKKCDNDRTCATLRDLKAYYTTNPQCLLTTTSICAYDVNRILILRSE